MKDSWKEDINKMFHQENLLYIPKVLQIKLISRYYNNLLASYFDINKTQKLIAQKYYWYTFWADIETYVKDCNICLAFKAVCYSFYGDLQLLPIFIH